MTTTATLPETGFVRISTVLAHLPIGRSTFWAGVRSGVYPPAYKLAPRTTAWKAEDIRALLEKLGGGAA